MGERAFLMKKHQKKHFCNIAIFTKFNLNIGDFSLWYSFGIGIKEKLKIYTLKKG